MCSRGHISDVYELLTAPPKNDFFLSKLPTWFHFNKCSNDRGLLLERNRMVICMLYFIRNILLSKIPNVWYHQFSYSDNGHHFNTRHASKFYFSLLSGKLMQTSVLCTEIRNGLPSDITHLTNKIVFKKCLWRFSVIQVVVIQGGLNWGQLDLVEDVSPFIQGASSVLQYCPFISSQEI